MRPRHKGIKIGQCAKGWINAGVIRNIIAHIQHRRGKDRRQPHCVHPQARNIIQPPRDARQIANAVAIVILKRPGIDLIGH